MRFLPLLALLAAPAAAQQRPLTVAKLPPPASITGATAAPSAQPALPGGPRMLRQTGPAIVSKAAPVNGVLTLYGNERCPTDNDGNEIVVCVRRSAAERFRVPKELREFQVTPENESWAVKAQAGLDAGVGVNGTGSCSAVGAGGATGCFLQQARAARRENGLKKEAEARVP